MNDSYLYLLTKAVITLVFVLGLLGVSLYALKQYMKRGGKGAAKSKPPVKVLNTFILGQKKNLAIVEVAGEIIVLGITPASIHFLTKIEREDSIEELKKFQGAGTRSIFNMFQF